MTLSGRHSFHTPGVSSDMSGFFILGLPEQVPGVLENSVGTGYSGNYPGTCTGLALLVTAEQ